MKKLLILPAVILLCGMRCMPRNPRSPTPPPPGVGNMLLSDLAVSPQPSLGISFASNQVNTYPRLAAAGMTIARINATWSFREPNRGVYDWRGLDQRIKAMQAVGIEPFITFAPDAPAYTEATKYGTPNRMPTDLAHWRQFVRATVERYDFDGKDDMPGLRARVKYWQAINEFTNQGRVIAGWAGTWDQFVAVNNATYAAVHDADQGANYCLGGISSGALDFLAAGGAKADLLKSITKRCKFDLVDGHFYGPESLIPARVKFLRTIARGAPIVCTEAGGPSLNVESYTPEAHFKAVMGINLEALSRGVKFVLWFRSNDGGHPTHGNSMTALWDADGNPKPGFYAYYLLAALLDGSTGVTGSNPYTISYRDGHKRTVEWGAGTINTKQASLQVTDLATGAYKMVPAGSRKVGQLPLVTGGALPVH